jgi:hypothetical protein
MAQIFGCRARANAVAVKQRHLARKARILHGGRNGRTDAAQANNRYFHFMSFYWGNYIMKGAVLANI